MRLKIWNLDRDWRLILIVLEFAWMMFVWTLFTKYTRDYVFNTKIDYIIDGSSYEISANEIYNVIKDEKFICNKENDRKIWTMN